MAPEAVAEAVRAYVEEANRLKHARRATLASDTAEFARIKKAQADIVTAIEAGRYSETLMDRLLDLETREKAIKARLSEAPIDAPDIHPNISGIYRRKVERLAEALNQPAERHEARDAIRNLIEKVILTPGVKRGEVNVMLHGEFGAIIEWVSGKRIGEGPYARHDDTPGADASGVSVSVVAGTRFHLNLRPRTLAGRKAEALVCPAHFRCLFTAAG